MDSPLLPREGDLRLNSIPVLHGETLGGRVFTLLDGIVTSAAETFGGRGRGGNVADVLFAALVQGGHVSTDEEVRGAEAVIELQGLLEMLLGGKVDKPLLRAAAKKGSYDQTTVDFSFGSLTLGVDASGHTSRMETTHRLEASAHFRLGSERSLADMDGVVAPLCDLIVFATRHPAFVTGLRLLPARTTSQGVVDTEQYARELRVLRAIDVAPAAERASSYYALWLNPGTVPDPAELLRAWWALRERLGPVWPLLFGTLQRPTLPLENQLLNLTAFAEGYHRTLYDEPPLSEEEAGGAMKAMLAAVEAERVRKVFRSSLRYANAQTQRKRVTWLADRATSVIDGWELDVRRFASEIADTRNWLTHWGDRGKHAQDGEGLYQLIARLNLVLTVNLLLDLGLAEDVVVEQVASGARRWRTLP